MATPQPSSSHAQSADGGQLKLQRCMMPLAEAPEPWLQLLVNNRDLLDVKSLQKLMSASWANCKSVLRCMRRWRLRVPVRATFSFLFMCSAWPHGTCNSGCRMMMSSLPGASGLHA